MRVFRALTLVGFCLVSGTGLADPPEPGPAAGFWKALENRNERVAQLLLHHGDLSFAGDADAIRRAIAHGVPLDIMKGMIVRGAAVSNDRAHDVTVAAALSQKGTEKLELLAHAGMVLPKGEVDGLDVIDRVFRARATGTPTMLAALAALKKNGYEATHETLRKAFAGGVVQLRADVDHDASLRVIETLKDEIKDFSPNHTFKDGKRLWEAFLTESNYWSGRRAVWMADALDKFVGNHKLLKNEKTGETPLHLAPSEEIARHLIAKHGAEIDARDKAGNTPFIAAVNRIGDATNHAAVLDVVRLLLGRDDAAHRALNADGKSALTIALGNLKAHYDKQTDNTRRWPFSWRLLTELNTPEARRKLTTVTSDAELRDAREALAHVRALTEFIESRFRRLTVPEDAPQVLADLRHALERSIRLFDYRTGLGNRGINLEGLSEEEIVKLGDSLLGTNRAPSPRDYRNTHR